MNFLIFINLRGGLLAEAVHSPESGPEGFLSVSSCSTGSLHPDHITGNRKQRRPGHTASHKRGKAFKVGLELFKCV